ncbi:MAG TPA: LacI family DNA-binding transcriptional regulator, partial [Nocardioidaceae bacterium]|nr:LacI family DNA-binding transcriptional regulator [Nocardioidaceae bacterium]
SKVLNGRNGVGEQTRRRVQQVIDDLGYVSPGSRPHREPDHDRWLQVIVDTLDNPYSSTLVAGIIDAAERADTLVVTRRIAAVNELAARQWADRLAATGCVGVVEVTSEVSSKRLAALRRVGCPLVVIDPVNAPATELNSVGATNWKGGKAAAEHLLELGHQHIHYVGGPGGSVSDQARVHGYWAAMRAAGVEVDLHAIPHGPFSYEQGLRAGGDVLDSTDRPTAIFAGCDAIAMGVFEAARKRGVRIPDELSVVGFDDTVLAHSSTPRLTTVRQPLTQMGAMAMRMIDALYAGEEPESRQVELATQLVVRDSTAPLDVRV